MEGSVEGGMEEQLIMVLLIAFFFFWLFFLFNICFNEFMLGEKNNQLLMSDCPTDTFSRPHLACKLFVNPKPVGLKFSLLSPPPPLSPDCPFPLS